MAHKAPKKRKKNSATRMKHRDKIPPLPPFCCRILSLLHRLRGGAIKDRGKGIKNKTQDYFTQVTNCILKRQPTLDGSCRLLVPKPRESLSRFSPSSFPPERLIASSSSGKRGKGVHICKWEVRVTYTHTHIIKYKWAGLKCPCFPRNTTDMCLIIAFK